MNIEELLEKIKDRSRDYVGMNGCLYQDITREELDLIVNEIERKDKAIEYISENMNSNSVSMLTSGKSTDIGYCIPVFEDLLDILKGSDKDEKE